jgi:hypothetical protein
MNYTMVMDAGRGYSGRLSRLKDVAVPIVIISACLLASASPESVRLFGFRLPPVCPFRTFTGFDCPGCGLTRALILAFHGQWRESYMMHLWGIPLAAFFAFRVFSELYLALRGRRVPPIFPPSLQRWKSHFIALSLLVPWVMKTVALLSLRFF